MSTSLVSSSIFIVSPQQQPTTMTTSIPGERNQNQHLHPVRRDGQKCVSHFRRDTFIAKNDYKSHDHTQTHMTSTDTFVSRLVPSCIKESEDKDNHNDNPWGVFLHRDRDPDALVTAATVIASNEEAMSRLSLFQHCPPHTISPQHLTPIYRRRS